MGLLELESIENIEKNYNYSNSPGKKCMSCREPIESTGNMMVQRAVRGADLGALSATGLHILANSDKLALYVANLSGTTNLTVAAVSFSANRIGD